MRLRYEALPYPMRLANVERERVTRRRDQHVPVGVHAATHKVHNGRLAKWLFADAPDMTIRSQTVSPSRVRSAARKSSRDSAIAATEEPSLPDM